MTNIGVIILHYKNYKETINCINCFIKQDSFNTPFNIKIVVVDNFSNDGSFEILYEKFKKITNISIIQTWQNLGFANGNNFGYYWFKNNCFDADYVITSNSDILFENSNLLYKWIVDVYHNSTFAVLGPDIFAPINKIHQNPNPVFKKNKFKMKILIIKKKLKLLFLVLFGNLYIKKKESYGISNFISADFSNSTIKKTLHGSFQVFSKIYFREYDYLYYPNTFLYREEDILRDLCDKKKLIMLYDKNFSVVHLQGSSSYSSSESERDRRIKRLKYEIKADKIYLEFKKSYLIKE